MTNESFTAVCVAGSALKDTAEEFSKGISLNYFVLEANSLKVTRRLSRGRREAAARGRPFDIQRRRQKIPQDGIPEDGAYAGHFIPLRRGSRLFHINSGPAGDVIESLFVKHLFVRDESRLAT